MSEKELKIRKISDMIPPQEVPEDLIEIDSVINKELVIHGFKARIGSYGDFLNISIEVDGEKATISTGGAVVMRKLEELQEKRALPVSCTIVKTKGRSGFLYYDLV